jgi:hypothetical protein
MKLRIQQISLRDFLLGVGIFGAALGVLAHAQAHPDLWPEILPPSRIPQGVVEGALTAMGLTLLIAAYHYSERGWWRLARVGASVAGVICLWFAAVDLCHQVHWCQRCGSHFHTVESRYYRWPLWQQRTDKHEDYLSAITTDLGVPCQHPYRTETLIRLWGFALPYPAVSATCGLSGGGTYADIRPYVLEMAKENPDLPAEFERKALDEQDRTYIQQVFVQIRARQKATAK